MDKMILFSDEGSNPKKMNSREIAELTNKLHSNVMADIRTLSKQVENQPEMIFQLGSYLDSNNQSRPMYLLSKKEVILLATGYNPILRLKLINRIEELETNSVKNLIPKSFAEALRLAADQQLQIEQQNLLILEQAPKVIAFENVIDSQNTYTLDSVSDILNIGRTTLAKMLEQKKWKTIREENGTSSTRYAEENGYAKTLFEYIKIGKKEIKTKRFVLKKKGLDKLINELTN
jgi:Rha family phage regulatory protein